MVLSSAEPPGLLWRPFPESVGCSSTVPDFPAFTATLRRFEAFKVFANATPGFNCRAPPSKTLGAAETQPQALHPTRTYGRPDPGPITPPRRGLARNIECPAPRARKTGPLELAVRIFAEPMPLPMIVNLLSLEIEPAYR